MEKLNKVFDYFDESPDADFEGNKSEKLVLLAEKKLGVKFPPSYREFLLRYGCGDIEGYEFYGIINDKFVNCVPDMVGVTIGERKQNKLPKQYVLIAANDESFCAIDTSTKTDDEENPVIVLDFDNLAEGRIMANSFEDFLFALFCE